MKNVNTLVAHQPYRVADDGSLVRAKVARSTKYGRGGRRKRKARRTNQPPRKVRFAQAMNDVFTAHDKLFRRLAVN